MPTTLDAYKSNQVAINLVNNKIVVTDNASYPGGVVNNITGIVTITQPDGVTRAGDWSSPDIYYSGGGLVAASIDLRRDSDGKPQQGEYTVRYDINHPSYLPTVLVRTFLFSYSEPDMDAVKSIDVFTPSLGVADATNYSISGFNTTSTSRAWSAIVGTLGTLTGTGASLDLKYGGSYYDASYTVTLSTTVNYAHPSYTYLTVIDLYTKTLNFTANTPPDVATLLTYLNTLKQRMDDLIDQCQNYDKAKDDYITAYVLYRHTRDRICKAQTDGLYAYIQQILDIYYNYVNTYVNTNAVIPAYDLGDCSGGGGTGSTAVMVEYKIGTTIGAPTAGTNTFVSTSFVGRDVVLFVGSIPMSKIDNGSGVYFTKLLASNTLTLTGMTWSTDSIVQFLIL